MTLTVTGTSGLSTTCDATVGVVDTSLPTMTCPPDRSVTCSEIDPAVTGTPSPTDSCDGGVDVTWRDTASFDCASGGLITRTWTATDDCGLTATCEQTITVLASPATGACCGIDTCMGQMTGVDCVNAGGIYQGDDVPCDAGPLDGSALFFDGVDDWIVVPTSPTLDLVGRSVSAEMWVNRSSTTTEDRILEGSGLFVGFFSNQRFFFGFLGGSFPNGALSNAPYLETNEWHHWAGTYDASTGETKAYRDGELVAEDVSTGVSQVSNLLIAARDNRAYHGGLDEIRIWNEVRSQADIRASMHTTLIGSEPGLVGYWRFDEGAGTTVTDLSAHGNTGTFVGDPQWQATSLDSDSDGSPDFCDLCVAGAGSGDVDGNGRVSPFDFFDLPDCLLGPGSPLGVGCECFDFDSEIDVDLRDFAAFQTRFAGP